MIRYISVLAIALLPYTDTCHAQAADSIKVVNSLTRCWRTLSHEYSNIYGLEEEEIKTYSKQKVCFTRDSVQMHYGVLYDPRYSIKKVNAENYTKDNFDCSKRKLGIYMDTLFEITISSFTKPTKKEPVRKLTDVITYDGECIYVVVDGVIFKMFDADKKTQPRSSN